MPGRSVCVCVCVCVYPDVPHEKVDADDKERLREAVVGLADASGLVSMGKGGLDATLRHDLPTSARP